MKLAVLFLGVYLLPGMLIAQDKLGELAVSEPEEKKIVVRSPDRAALVIVSEVADLSFESTRVIHDVRPRGASEWNLIVEPGRQIITIRAPGYQPVKTEVINLQAKRAYSLKITQVRAIPGKLLINTDPPDAEILINGAKIEAKTPFVLEEALPGRFNIEVIKEGYRSAFKSMEVASNQVTQWDVELTQTAVRVMIELENKEVREVGILINGAPMGVAPGAIYLEPGTYQLVLQKPGFKFPEKVIEIDFGDEIRLSEKLIAVNQPVYKKWWFYAGTAAVATTTAALLMSGNNAGTEPLTADPPTFPGGQ